MNVRWICSTTLRLVKKNKLPPRPKFTKEMEAQCEEKFLHGGRGPGGQKINKCNSKVQLKHLETGIVVTCQETRSRESNRKIAREKMALEIARYLNPDSGTDARTEAIQRWVVQGKRAKEKKSKLKHAKHEEERRLKQQEALRRESEIIESL
ncbi:hypothetical protein HG537_0G04070 [Torulaspora globosa]|uniref:Prokaryotic-type class I peptide chain release factors domain-containing protein n=1 Tax=Torulaspora globosa TaxID=48254 RepID=A0A7H9I073_9SACH|nr:hypothetical protein HG537_0G04070 [Torulaspora sp. CBS 2947]